jgi:hypothetical protein
LIRLPARSVVVTVIAATLASCGGGSSHPGSSTITPPTTLPNSAGLTMSPPPGWVTRVLPSPGGLVFADTAADLAVTVPIGPRLTAQPCTAAPTATSLVADLDRSPMYSPTVAQQTFGHYKQVPVLRFTTAATTASGETVEIAAITVAPGKAYVFTLEAPSAASPAVQATLEGIVSSATINPELFPN